MLVQGCPDYRDSTATVHILLSQSPRHRQFVDKAITHTHTHTHLHVHTHTHTHHIHTHTHVYTHTSYPHTHTHHIHTQHTHTHTLSLSHSLTHTHTHTHMHTHVYTHTLTHSLTHTHTHHTGPWWMSGWITIVSPLASVFLCTNLVPPPPRPQGNSQPDWSNPAWVMQACVSIHSTFVSFPRDDWTF